MRIPPTTERSASRLWGRTRRPGAALSARSTESMGGTEVDPGVGRIPERALSCLPRHARSRLRPSIPLPSTAPSTAPSTRGAREARALLQEVRLEGEAEHEVRIGLTGVGARAPAMLEIPAEDRQQRRLVEPAPTGVEERIGDQRAEPLVSVRVARSVLARLIIGSSIERMNDGITRSHRQAELRQIKHVEVVGEDPAVRGYESIER